MPNNYQFIDAYGSVLTASSSVVGGAHQPIVQIGSVLSAIPVMLSGQSSVSGTVGASIIGLTPVNVTNLNLNVGGSVLSYPAGTIISSVISSTPSSLLTGASIFGQLPAGTQLLGSVVAIQGTSPWNMSGSVIAVTTNPSSLLTGNNVQRNDTVASFLGGDKTWNPISSDSAGRVLTKPFVSQDGTLIEYTGSIVSGSTLLIQSSIIGKRSYVTDFWFANTGSVATLITFKDGSTSVLGYTIAPSGSGSNSQGINIPHRTAPAQDLTITPATAVSILYITVKGYIAP